MDDTAGTPDDQGSADLERAYSPSSMVGGSSAPFEAQYRRLSSAARDQYRERLVELPGGSLLVQGSSADAPLLVFVHGGYWQALSAADSMFPAADLVPHGWAFAAVDYTLAPGASIDEMVVECSRVLAQFGDGRLRVVLVGHSAGAQLVAMAALAQKPPLRVDTVVLVSGIYDLRPIVRTSMNAALGLDEAHAARVSPLLVPTVVPADVVVAWADSDTSAFIEQSKRYAEHLQVHGCRVRVVESAGRHHFDVLFDLGDPATPLGAAVLNPTR